MRIHVHPRSGVRSEKELAAVTMRYGVGSKADQVMVEAGDALIAALEVKAAHPEAAITYVRKRNARGDRRHPHPDPGWVQDTCKKWSQASRRPSTALRPARLTLLDMRAVPLSG